MGLNYNSGAESWNDVSLEWHTGHMHKLLYLSYNSKPLYPHVILDTRDHPYDNPSCEVQSRATKVLIIIFRQAERPTHRQVAAKRRVHSKPIHLHLPFNPLRCSQEVRLFKIVRYVLFALAYTTFPRRCRQPFSSGLRHRHEASCWR